MSQRQKRNQAGPVAVSQGSDDRPMAPLFPNVPLEQLAFIQVSVKANIDGELKLYPLNNVSPDTTVEQIQATYGGGDYEVQGCDENERPIQGVFRELNLLGQSLWRPMIDEYIRSQHIDSQQVVQQGQQWQQNGWQQPWGFQQPGMNGMPQQPMGYMPGPMGMPFNPMMNPWMQGMQQTQPIEVSTGPNGEKAHVDPGLPPAQRQARFDELNRQRTEAIAAGGQVGMLQAVMQMSQANTQMLVGVLQGNRQNNSSDEVNMLRTQVSQLRGDVQALQNQNNFLNQQGNKLIADMQAVRDNAARDASTEQSKFRAALQEKDNEINTLKNKVFELEGKVIAKDREKMEKEYELKGKLGDLEAKLKSEGKFNAQGIVEAVAGVGGVVAGVTKDVFEAKEKADAAKAQQQQMNGGQMQAQQAQQQPAQQQPQQFYMTMPNGQTMQIPVGYMPGPNGSFVPIPPGYMMTAQGIVPIPGQPVATPQGYVQPMQQPQVPMGQQPYPGPMPGTLGPQYGGAPQVPQQGAFGMPMPAPGYAPPQGPGGGYVAGPGGGYVNGAPNGPGGGFVQPEPQGQDTPATTELPSGPPLGNGMSQ